MNSEDAAPTVHDRYRQLFERNVAGVYRVTPEGEILDVNEAMASMLGYDREELVEAGAEAMHFEAVDREEWVERVRGERELTGHVGRLRRKDGREVWLLENAALVRDNGREVILGTAIDVTERKRLEEELSRLAHHDTLTGLPNRRLLREMAEKSLARADRTRTRVGILYLDLVRFKRINDVLGHAAGDRVLEEVAERLAGSVRGTDTLARIGGDEFAVLLVDLAEPENAVAAARHIVARLDPPFEIEGETFHLDARVGVAIYPDHASDLDALLSHADLMMIQSDLEADRITLESPKAERANREDLAFEEAFLEGLESDQLELHYQPIFGLPDARPVAAEALLRWRHPQRGLLSAAEFIGLAERAGRMRQIDRSSIDSAVRQLAAWGDDGPAWIAVNLAPATFEDPRLIESVSSTLARHAVEPRRLALEVTERATMRDPDLATETFRELRDLGVRIVIDDFGRGHSSLAYLLQYRFDALKIDRFFVHGLGEDAEHERLAEGIVGLCGGLDLTIIGEGVETERQLAWLIDQACDLVQGFHLARPMPAEEMLELWNGGG